MRFVLDNSVVCGWLLQNQATAYCDAIAQRLQSAQAIAPPLLALEYTNVLRMACKRQTMLAFHAQQMLSMLAQLPIEIDTSVPQPAQLLDLALRYDLTSYDAIYLDLALRHRLPIATQDRDLAHAAQVAGVGVVSD